MRSSGGSSAKNVCDAGTNNASRNRPAIVHTKASRRGVSGAAMIESTSKPIHVKTITAVVRASASDTPASLLASPYPRNVAIAASAPAGTAKRPTRATNPGRNRSELGASARKNDGIPIVSAPISVRCRGRNGNANPATPIASDSSIA